jgi:HEAT repeat protein
MRFILLLLVLLISCFSDPSKEVPKLITELNSKESRVRNQACLKLGSYGEDALDAVPYIINLLHDPNNGVRTSAAFALRKIGGDKAEKALLQYQKEE